MASAEWLMNHSDWVQFASIMSWIWRTIEWAIVKGLYFLCQGAENVIDSIFKVTELLNDGVVGKYYHAAQAVAWIVLAVMLVWIGIRYVIGKEISLKNNLIQLVLGACIVVGGAGVIDWGLQVATGTFQDTKEVVSSDDSTLKSSLSFNIIKDNTADLMYIGDHNQWNTLLNNANKKEKEATKNELSSDVFMNMDLTEVLEKEQIQEIKNKNKEAGKALGLEIVGTNKNNKYETKEIKNGWFSLFDEGYFRYGARFMPMIIGLVVMLCAFLLTAFIIVTNILDLVFVKILSPIMAVSDIDTGQRLKNMAMEAFKSLIVIACSGISLGIFSRYFTWVGQQDFGVVPYTVLLLAGLKVCIDGSHVFGKLLGVDVGLHDGWKSAMGAYAGMKGVASAGKGAVSTGKAVASGVGNVAHGVKEAINGINKKIENHTIDSIHDEMKNENNGQQFMNNDQKSLPNEDIQNNQNIAQDSTKNIDQQNTPNQNQEKNNINDIKKGGYGGNNIVNDNVPPTGQENSQDVPEAPSEPPVNLGNPDVSNSDNPIDNIPPVEQENPQDLPEPPADYGEPDVPIPDDYFDNVPPVEQGNPQDLPEPPADYGEPDIPIPDDYFDNVPPVEQGNSQDLPEPPANLGDSDVPNSDNSIDNIPPVEQGNSQDLPEPPANLGDSDVPNSDNSIDNIPPVEQENLPNVDINDSLPSNEGNVEPVPVPIPMSKPISKDNILEEVNSYDELDLTKPVYRTRDEFEQANRDLIKPDPSYMKQQELKQYEDQIDEMMGINRKK